MLFPIITKLITNIGQYLEQTNQTRNLLQVGSTDFLLSFKSEYTGQEQGLKGTKL